jgi:hypothetical protein
VLSSASSHSSSPCSTDSRHDVQSLVRRHEIT